MVSYYKQFKRAKLIKTREEFDALNIADLYRMYIDYEEHTALILAVVVKKARRENIK